MNKTENNKKNDGSENIDKIRDILFGNNISDFEQRFSDIEKTLSDELITMRNEQKKMFESLETYVKNEIQDIYSSIELNKEERLAKAKKIEGELDELNTRLSAHKEESHKVHREIRDTLLNQFKSITSDVQNQGAELKSKLIAEVDKLQDKKTDRLNLAALFTEMALQLRGETEKTKKESAEGKAE